MFDLIKVRERMAVTGPGSERREALSAAEAAPVHVNAEDW